MYAAKERNDVTLPQKKTNSATDYSLKATEQ